MITKNDLLTGILEEELDEITRDDDTLISSAIAAAVAESRMYLFDSFDVDLIFAKTGAARHALLVQLLRDISIYYIVSRCQAGQEMSDRAARYERAIEWLKRVAKTEVYTDLPRRVETRQEHIKWGSVGQKRSNHF